MVLVLGSAIVVTTLYFLGWQLTVIAVVLYCFWNAIDAHELERRLRLNGSPSLRTLCPECSGTGKIRTATTAASMYSPFFASKCPTCHGMGYLPYDSAVT